MTLRPHTLPVVNLKAYPNFLIDSLNGAFFVSKRLSLVRIETCQISSDFQVITLK